MESLLQSNHIWAMFLNQHGGLMWSVDIPQEIPTNYTIGEIAAFSKAYLKDYSVFVWDMEDGLLVLGYPKDSYTKIASNYLSIQNLESTDERLDLRHGLGLVLVRQIVSAHHRTVQFSNLEPHGFLVKIEFKLCGKSASNPSVNAEK